MMDNPYNIIEQRLIAIENKIDSLSLPQVQKHVQEIISRTELCIRLNITEPTVIKWEKKNKIPYFRIGRRVRYDWHKVVEALGEGKSGKSSV